MISFIGSIILLLAGYFFYSRVIERIFGANENILTPAYTSTDGVDYVPMKWGKVFLIQFLNIAGLGPIFGAVAGAMWGPVAFIWIVLGNIFAGAVHDYLSGMMSIRRNGASISEIVGEWMGNGVKQFMRGFTLILMLLVGAVFVSGPAAILNGLFEIGIPTWGAIVFIYYILATMLPIDKLIGHIYPLFGFALLFMAIGILFGIISNNYSIPEVFPYGFTNMHHNPDAYPIWPLVFITIACGAISGFHATQSPLMARCIENEKLGRRVFYGAMVTEGVVALIWAAAGMAYFGGVDQLNTIMTEHKGNAAWVVNVISNSLLGKLGGILALLGVVAAPITSGDTAFRSARLIVADFLHLDQRSIKKRMIIVIPLFVVGFLITQFDFAIIWRYMAWSNQTLATIVLWTITLYLASKSNWYFLTLIPALFMTAVISTYIFVAPEGLQLPYTISVVVGVVIASLSGVLFFVKIKQTNQ